MSPALRLTVIRGWCGGVWGEGGSSLGCATVLLAKLLKAAELGLIQRGTRLLVIWSWMNLCSLSLTLETLVSSSSHESSNTSSAAGSKSLVYCRMPWGVDTQQAHMQEWYLSRPSSR